MRVVLDTNILIRANPGTNPAGLARELLLTVQAPPNVLVLSAAIIDEVVRVLRYPHVRSRWPLPDALISKYASLLVDVAYMRFFVPRLMKRFAVPMESGFWMMSP